MFPISSPHTSKKLQKKKRKKEIVRSVESTPRTPDNHLNTIFRPESKAVPNVPLNTLDGQTKCPVSGGQGFDLKD